MPFYEGSAYYEIPITTTTSSVFAPWLETNYDSIDGWRAEATIGVKHAFFNDDGRIMAVQAGALWNSHPEPGCGEGGAELRWLGGMSFSNGAFLNAEAATRLLDGGCGGERVDLTAGYRVSNWLGMVQVFADVPRDGHEEYVKAQISVARFGDDGGALQLGVRARVDGGGEPALVLSWWRRPGD